MVHYSVDYISDSFALLQDYTNRFDVTITDPPYDAHCQANQSSGTAMKRQVQSGKGGGIPRVTPAFDPLAGYAFIGDLLQVTRRWVAVFCTVEAFGLIRNLYPNEYVRGCIWYKPNSMGQLTGDRPACAFEGIALLHPKGKKRWNGRGSFGIWACNGTRGEKDRHPNQKPLKLCQKLVALFSDPGETIFDPFCGGGRIGEAAVMLDRSYVGFDNDPYWVGRAKARVALAFPDRLGEAEALELCRMPKIPKVTK